MNSMEQEKYCISIGEPWDFESKDGQNIIKGVIISKKSNKCIVFKSNHYLEFDNSVSCILILTPRYKENDFSDLTKGPVVVNGGIFPGKYDEKLGENELKQNMKYGIIGSIRKVVVF